MSKSGNESTAEFDDFMASGDVEVGSEVAAAKEDQPAKRRGPPKMKEAPAADDQGDDQGDDDQNDDRGAADDQNGDDQGGDDDQNGDDQDGEGDDDQQRQRRKPSDRIRELTRRNRELQRQLEGRGNSELLARLENLERGLQGENRGGNQPVETPEPDPTDTDKYPLGHLDDRYIEDKLEWLADKKATERADAVLQRQQEYENSQAVERQQQEILVKVDDLAARGEDLFDDFQESVVEAGMRGDWALSQATFEAAHEAEHGAQILYDLAQDKAEAKRVANLSPYQQLKFVQERDAEIAKGKQPRRVPQAGDPPRNPARGANSRTSINPATDNLDDFEKAWANDAKKGYR